MLNVSALLVGFVLGMFAVCLLVFLVVLHKPRIAAPTKHHRKWPDRPERKAEEVVEPMYMYGVTGEER